MATNNVTPNGAAKPLENKANDGKIAIANKDAQPIVVIKPIDVATIDKSIPAAIRLISKFDKYKGLDEQQTFAALIVEVCRMKINAEFDSKLNADYKGYLKVNRKLKAENLLTIDQYKAECVGKFEREIMARLNSIKL